MVSAAKFHVFKNDDPFQLLAKDINLFPVGDDQQAVSQPMDVKKCQQSPLGLQ